MFSVLGMADNVLQVSEVEPTGERQGHSVRRVARMCCRVPFLPHLEIREVYIQITAQIIFGRDIFSSCNRYKV